MPAQRSLIVLCCVSPDLQCALDVWQAVGEYFLASAFEKILVQKSGYVGLTGAGAQSLFFKGFFDKYGIKPEVFSREVGGLG